MAVRETLGGEARRAGFDIPWDPQLFPIDLACPEVAALLKRQLWRWMANGGPDAPPPAEVRVAGEAEEQLQSLGYIN